MLRTFFVFAILLALPEFTSADLVTGVTIEDVSSQLDASFDREAGYVVDGSGMTGNTHATTPDGTMWLTAGNGAFQNGVPDPNGDGRGVITFDLGENYDLSDFQLWNYNESGGSFTNRSMNQVQILTSSTDASPTFVDRGTFSFAEAPGTSGYQGDNNIFNVSNVRLVRFNILSSWGDTNGFVGMSEIQFNGSLSIPEPGTFCLLSLSLAALFGRRAARSTGFSRN